MVGVEVLSTTVMKPLVCCIHLVVTTGLQVAVLRVCEGWSEDNTGKQQFDKDCYF